MNAYLVSEWIICSYYCIWSNGTLHIISLKFHLIFASLNPWLKLGQVIWAACVLVIWVMIYPGQVSLIRFYYQGHCICGLTWILHWIIAFLWSSTIHWSHIHWDNINRAWKMLPAHPVETIATHFMCIRIKLSSVSASTVATFCSLL